MSSENPSKAVKAGVRSKVVQHSTYGSAVIVRNTSMQQQRAPTLFGIEGRESLDARCCRVARNAIVAIA
jgi:hypothetical protein